MGAGRRLKEALVGAAIELPSELVERFPELATARYRRGGLPPRIGGWLLGTSTVAAMALWRTVFLAPRTPWSAELLLHEFRHVQQFAGDRAFPVRYVWESLRHGYHSNRYEIEARSWAGTRVRSAPASTPSSQDS